MLKRFFALRSKANRAITADVYAAIVAAARQPELYSQAEVPDTPLGRYEMLSLHLFLLLHRLRDGTGGARDLAQEVTDLFISELDSSLRELGIGDIGIPKRIKKLARMFYGRAQTYGEALDKGDAGLLAEALRRNIQPGRNEWPQALLLAQYVLVSHRHLAEQPVDLILQGRPDFIAPGEMLAGPMP